MVILARSKGGQGSQLLGPPSWRAAVEDAPDVSNAASCAQVEQSQYDEAADHVPGGSGHAGSSFSLPRQFVFSNASALGVNAA